MPPIIQFDQVSKSYMLRHERARSFQDAFVRLLKTGKTSEAESFWALKDVSLEIRAGEMVGFVGQNGAGKSTILKLIARTNVPTSGRVHVHGKVSALLELGTGFHPDLTGRENVYLNGSLMGFGQADMRARFDDIVEFSEIGHFIDVPVRNYSSGMMMRLGFAVATSFQPDILLIDEVLAVGDEDFQRKCMDKMRDFRRVGKTMVLVSHNLEAVRNLCQRVIWLENGKLVEAGDAVTVVDHYLQSANLKTKERMDHQLVQRRKQAGKTDSSIASSVYNRWGSGEILIERVALLNQDEQETNLFQTGDKMIVRMWYEAADQVAPPVFGIGLYKDGVLIAGPNTLTARFPLALAQPTGHVDYVVDFLPLLQGVYELSVAAYDETLSQAYDHHERLYAFRVEPKHAGESLGIIALPGHWQHTPPGGASTPPAAVQSD